MKARFTTRKNYSGRWMVIDHQRGYEGMPVRSFWTRKFARAAAKAMNKKEAEKPDFFGFPRTQAPV